MCEKYETSLTLRQYA